MKPKNPILTNWFTLLLTLLISAGCAWPAKAADITPGYTFSNGEQNVTAVKLNNATAGTINSSFVTGKSAKTALADADLFIIYDPSAAAFRKVTLSSLLNSAVGSNTGNATNLFSYGTLTANGPIMATNRIYVMGSTSSPGYIIFTNASAAADEKLWSIKTDEDEFSINGQNDALSSTYNAFNMIRTGWRVSEMDLNATNVILINTPYVWMTGGLRLTGSLTNSAMTASTIPYFDGSKVMKSATLDTGLTLTSGTLSLDTQLVSLSGLSYSGNTGKVIAVNGAEDGFELVAQSGSSGLTNTFNTDQFTLLNGTNVNFKDGMFVTNAYLYGTTSLGSSGATLDSIGNVTGLTSLSSGIGYFSVQFDINNGVDHALTFYPTGSVFHLGVDIQTDLNFVGGAEILGDAAVGSLSTATFDYSSDKVLISDSSAGNLMRLSTLPAFTGDSGAGGVIGMVPAPAAGDAAASKFLKADGTWSAPSGSGYVNKALAQVRLSLVNGQSITTTNATNTTVYCVNHNGDGITFYSGSGSTWTNATFTNVACVVPSVANKNYDVFMYDAGTYVTNDVVAWTDDTTRATDLVLQDGIYVKSGATKRKYVGTFRTTETAGQVVDTQRRRFVYNYYNKVSRNLLRQDAAASWNYNSATVRQANTNALNQIEVVIGIEDTVLDLKVVGLSSQITTTATALAGIGENSTTTISTDSFGGRTTMPAGSLVTNIGIFNRTPRLGYSYFAWLEASQAAGTTTFFGNNTGLYAGLVGKIEQ